MDEQPRRCVVAAAQVRGASRKGRGLIEAARANARMSVSRSDRRVSIVTARAAGLG